MIYESSLYHHGIKGQHWGKRNGPPYPLDRKNNRKQKDFNRLSKKSKKANKSIEKRNRTATTMVTSSGDVLTAVNGKADQKMYKNISKVDNFVKKISKRYGDVSSDLILTEYGKFWVDTHGDDLRKRTNKYNI